MSKLEYWLQWQVPVCAFILTAPSIIAVNLMKRVDKKNMVKSTDLWVPCWRNLNPMWLLFCRTFAFVSLVVLMYHTVATFGPSVFLFYSQWTFTLVLFYFATCAGAVVLSDIVFWCLLLPFMTGENFKLTLLLGLMHSVNAVFLLLDSALSSLTFFWHRLAYFVLWSSVYVAFHWVLHALGSTWWPYPFLEISTPWAPLWYFGLALVHIPCYGLYALLMKAKGSLFSKLFPHAFVRVSVEKKQT